MTMISFLFWALIVVTTVVAARWGAMIGLIGFVFALMVGAVAVSRLAPPKPAVGADRVLALEALVAEQVTVVRFPKVGGRGAPAAVRGAAPRAEGSQFRF